MCLWIERSYGCGHKTNIASSWCSTYSRKKKMCKPYNAYYELRMNEKCSNCRRTTTPQHRIYIRQIYEDLKLRHPERNWDHIGRLADLPDITNHYDDHYVS